PQLVLDPEHEDPGKLYPGAPGPARGGGGLDQRRRPARVLPVIAGPGNTRAVSPTRRSDNRVAAVRGGGVSTGAAGRVGPAVRAARARRTRVLDAGGRDTGRTGVRHR